MEGNKLKYLFEKSTKTLREEGFKSLAIKTRNYLTNKAFNGERAPMKDFLFINGCTLPHPERYRVDHQVEQLESTGYSVDKVFYENLSLEQLKFYRGFIFFRCPITPTVDEFINKAHYFNKTCFFDIDDLVINRDYTDKIPFVAAMNKSDKAVYDDGVIRMEKTLKKCDYLITTTPALARELQNRYKKEVLINKNVASEKMAELSQSALKYKRDDNKIIIGYLSGSITHNPDFELIKTPLLRIMEEYDNVYLEVMGFLDIPEEFEKYSSRIIQKKFTDWHHLPKIIAELDINLAPIEKSIFNEAKSENKWTEASLVKTLTIASNFGAFKNVIEDKKTGLLADSQEEWYEKIKFAIENPKKAKQITQKAYEVASEKYITTTTGGELSRFIDARMSKYIGFALPTTNISGGVNVVIKHANILRNNGFDVVIINMDKPTDNIKNEDGEINVFSAAISDSAAHFDILVATLWTTLRFVKEYPLVKQRKYLVQNFETKFAKIGSHARIEANATYNDKEDVEYITISKWCKKWLKNDYDETAVFAPNGIETKKFNNRKRKFDSIVKILIEGNSSDYYKNVDESFEIAKQLAPNKFEIQYLSYEGEPKSWYKVDKFFHKIPADEVHKIYEGADILIKSSLLESFSYPPLEMMATGGFCIVAPNEGNIEYLKDGENCLFYEQGNAESAIEKINQIISDSKLRDKLSQNAKITVAERDWKIIEPKILELYK